jgi:site-specific DNA-methyltransferase (adenine-specific)
MQLIHGDCLDFMPKIPDESIDMILCDLPYGTTKNKFDVIIPFDKLWAQYNRIIKSNGCIALFCQAPFSILLAASNIKMFRYEWIWQKNRATGNLNANKMPLKSHENIFIFYKHLPTYHPQKSFGHKCYKTKRNRLSSNYGGGEYANVSINTDGSRYPRDIIDFPVVNSFREQQLHPTQKPVDLLEYMIKTYTNVGDIVLDNCMGSGSTGVACANTGREFIGIEREKRFFDIAKNRIMESTENGVQVLCQ